MKFKISEDKKKRRKKHEMGYFTSFLPDKEKGIEQFNKSVDFSKVDGDIYGGVTADGGNAVSEAVDDNLSAEQKEFFKNSKIRDKEGNLLVCYHGTKNPGFKYFDSRNAKSQFGEYKFKNYNVNYFTTDEDIATGYTDIGVKENGNVYACYLNVVNPYIVDENIEDEWRSWKNLKDSKARKKFISNFDRLWRRWRWTVELDDDDLDDLNHDLYLFNLKLVKDEDFDRYHEYRLINKGNNSLYGAERSVLTPMTIEEMFDDDNYEDLRDAVVGEDEDDYILTTDDIVRYVLTMNEEDGTDYDGIIIPEVIDIGPQGNMFSPRTTDIITLESSSQIKRIDNLKPTKSSMIDEDVSNVDFIDALDKEFGQSEVYMWSTYILPNGHFLNPDNSKDLEDEDIRYEHCDFDDWLYEKYGKYQGDILKYCMKMNTTYPYIVLPENRITPQQIYSLRKIIDNGDFEYSDDAIQSYVEITGDYDNSKINLIEKPLLVDDGNSNAKIYDLEYDTADDIIKDINRFYMTGSFLNESIDEKMAYHYGDLDVAKKAEKRYQMSGGRSTGHFGTGFYALSKPCKDTICYSKRDIWGVDLDKYNLFKPKSEREAYDLHDCLSMINTNVDFNSYDEDEIINEFDIISDKFVRGEDNEEVKHELKSYLLNQGFNADYVDYIMWSVDEERFGEADARIKQYIRDNDEDLSRMIKAEDKLCEIFGKDVSEAFREAVFSESQEDSKSTVFMKNLGYEGIDVTDLEQLDNFRYGSVIYDLKPNTYKKIEKTISESVETDRIRKLFDECVSELRRIGYQVDDDIRIEEYSATSRLADMTPVPGDDGLYRLRVSKYLYDETDDVIKDTILHEIAHYLVGKKALERGIYLRDRLGNWTIRREEKSRWLGHGTEWKKIRDYINFRLGTNLERTTDSEIFRKASEEKVKYFVTCKHCGQVLPYTRKSKFVRDPNAIDPVTKDYIWVCGNCNMSGQFEVKENKK